MNSMVPILVVVSMDDYACYSLTPRATRRDKQMFKYIKDSGGINLSVPPGEYYFNLEEKDGELHALLDKKTTP